MWELYRHDVLLAHIINEIPYVSKESRWKNGCRRCHLVFGCVDPSCRVDKGVHFVGYGKHARLVSEN